MIWNSLTHYKYCKVKEPTVPLRPWVKPMSNRTNDQDPAVFHTSMHHFFDKLSSKGKKSHQSDASPPRWTPADEESHGRGRYAEATYDEYQEAELFCSRHNVERAKLLPSNMVLRLSQEGCKPWRMTPPTSPRFKGIVEYGTENESLMGVTKVVTGNRCKDVCIFSNLPIMAGLYDINGKRGIYYEVVVRKMGGIIAIGK